MSEILRKQTLCGVDQALLKAGKPYGLVFGFALVTEEDGRPYHDTDGDYFPEDVVLAGSIEFMKGDRVVNLGHGPQDVGQAVFGFPLTKEISAAMNIQSEKYGFMIGAKVDDSTFRKFETGELTGFSVEGSYTARDM